MRHNMRQNRTYIVRVNDMEIARYTGHYGGAFQVATNHAFDLYNECQERAKNGEPEYAEYEVTVNNHNIKEYIY